MIGLLVLALMAWNFYIGYRRGLFMQAYYVVSVIIAMCVAAYFYKSLGEAINLWVPYTNPTKDASVAFLQTRISSHLTVSIMRASPTSPFIVWPIMVCVFLGFSSIL